MQDPIALLQSLTLPAGATTGARIELDGTTGEIRFYSTAGNLVLQLDGAQQLRFFQDITGGGLIGAHQVDDLLMVDPGAIANTFEVLPTGGGVDVLLWGKSLPRGRLDTARIIANVGGITAEQDVGLSVTWDAIATHVYRLEAHARGMTTSLVGNTRVSITDSANTHLVDDDSRTDSAGIVPAGTHLFTDVEGVSGTVTYKVRAAVLTGGGTGTLAATPEARLSVYDMGSA